MFSELAFTHIRCCLSAIPSDLMKSTAVDESLSSMNQQFCSRENQLLQTNQEVTVPDAKQLVAKLVTSREQILHRYPDVSEGIGYFLAPHTIFI